MGRGLGLAELGNKAELDQLGLEFWLNWIRLFQLLVCDRILSDYHTVFCG